MTKFDADGREMIEVPTGGGGGGGGIALQAGTQTATTGTVVFSNSNAISFGMAGSTRVTASYAFNLSAGTTSNNLNAATFADSNGLAFGLSGSVVTGSYTVPSTAGLISAINVSAGTTSNNLSALTFSNGSGVSFGINGSVITASVAPAAGAQTGISGIQVSDTTYTSGTVSWRNANGISFGSSGANGISASYTVPAAQTGISGFANSQTTYTSGTVSLSEMGYFTIRSTTGNQYQLSVGDHAFSADASSTYRTLTFQDSNGISFSNNGGAVRLTHALQFTSNTSAITSNALNTSASRVFNVIAATNNTGGGTASLSSNVSFSNANGATFYTSAGNAVALSYTVPTVPAAQTGISGIANSQTTYTSGTVSFSELGAITIRSTTGNQYQFSVAAQSAQTGISGLQVSDTTYTSGTVSFRNANGISFGSSGANGISASYTVPTETPFGVSAGTQSVSTGTLVFSNSNNVTFGMSGSSRVTASYALNVSAGTTSNALSGVTFSDSNGVAFGLNASTITANVGYISYYANLDQWGQSRSLALAQSTSQIAPFTHYLPGSYSYARFFVSQNAASTTFATTANTTFSCSILQTFYAMVYSRGTGASSRSLMSVTSGSAGMSQRFSFGAGTAGSQYTVSIQITYPREGATTDNLSTSYNLSTGTITISTNQMSDFVFMRYLDIPFANSLSAGNYWMAVGVSSTTSTQGTAALSAALLSQSFACQVQTITSGAGTMVVANMGSATNSSNDISLGFGSYTSNAIGPVVALDYTNVSSAALRPNLYFNLIRQA